MRDWSSDVCSSDLLSFIEQSLMGHGGWVGTANYAEALSDPTMWATLGHTIMFTVMSTIPLEEGICRFHKETP